MKPKIVVLHDLKFPVLDELKKYANVVELKKDYPLQGEELIKSAVDADGIICLLTDKFTKEVIENLQSVKIISTVSAGYDHIDLEEATKKGIYVFNAADPLTISVAEFAFALMLSVARRVVEGDKLIREGNWKSGWSLTFMLGRELKGKTLGIVGLGKIGKEIAKRAKCFGMNVIYYSRTRKLDFEEEYKVTFKDFQSVLSESDFLILSVSLTPETKNMIGKRELSLMKKDAFLINISRGAVVDEEALIEALKNKVIAGAALDVFQKEPVNRSNVLVSFENVVLTPHIASATVEARKGMAELAVKNMLQALQGVVNEDCLVNREVLKIRKLNKII
ncbi:MAG: D-glycerate dehydrogenase [Thermoproteota archaeon]|nr:D-glycerate dehydrogenase [Candidatus Brockarchaeota archaeon]